MNGWQQMDTAPQDGTKFLACARGPGGVGIVVARQKPGWRGFHTVPGDWSCNPTHWMPLPDTPTLVHPTLEMEGGNCV